VTVFNYGPYKGQEIASVAIIDPDYVIRTYETYANHGIPEWLYKRALTLAVQDEEIEFEYGKELDQLYDQDGWGNG